MRTDLLLFVLGWSAGWWLLARVVRPSLSDSAFGGAHAADGLVGEGRSSVTVVVPARNEVRTLPTLLASLEPQLRVGDEVLVVDDHSDDGTAALARGSATRMLPAPTLPDGWAGKCWACWTGAQHATNEVLVFLDADVQLEPGGLDRLVAEQRRHAGLLSVQPFHAVQRSYERLSSFFNVVAMMGVDAFTPLDRTPRGAFGATLVAGRDEYFELGGHAAIRGEVLDDMALARSWADADRPLTVLAGRGTVRFRMYPDGFAHLVEGWSKNVAGGAMRIRLSTLVLVFLWVTACLSATWWALRAPFAPADGEVTMAVAAYVLVAGQLWWMLRRIGSFGLHAAALFPIPLAFFLVVFVRSALLTLVRGRVSWKGREIATRGRHAA
jgi:4,4'-diaponeurosporenoate glycosyltransferase